uniref:Uncharacterized protein n=1 Tax=Globodera rostochiensis TaxID=31243 RepID=A0A914HA22_GLORO
MVAKCSAFIVQLLCSMAVHYCLVAGDQRACYETLRYQGGNKNVPAEMKIPLKKWRWSILEENNYIVLCVEDVGCQSLFCEDKYGEEVFRLNGCQTPGGHCSNEAFDKFCPTKTWCSKCEFNNCNNRIELTPSKTTTNTTTENPLVKNASAVTPSDLLNKLLFGNDSVNASTTENPVNEASTNGTGVLLLTKPYKTSSDGAVTLSNGLLLVLLFGALFFN